MSIITVSREFGSGGRELGKRLADELGFAYYDKEIITEAAKELSLDADYLERAAERNLFTPRVLTFSRTLASYRSAGVQGSYLLAQQHRVIKQLAAGGDCVIVGRGADRVLEALNPITLFVYADMPAKIARCRSRERDGEQLTDREWERKIKQVDKARAENYALLSSLPWGDMHCYGLCVNTTGMQIKQLVPFVAAYARARLERNNV